MTNEILEMALQYADIGIPIMPLHGINNDGSYTNKTKNWNLNNKINSQIITQDILDRNFIKSKNLLVNPEFDQQLTGWQITPW